MLTNSTFNGNSHTVRYQEQTLFDTLTKITFENVVFERSTTKFGAVAKEAIDSSIHNVAVKSGHMKYNCRVGGIVGYIADSTITDCTNYAKVEDIYNGDPDYSSNIGGIVGRVDSTFSSCISNCSNYGEVVGYNQNVGCIVGKIIKGHRTDKLQHSTAYVTNCANHGNVTTRLAKPTTGGIIGVFNRGAPDLSISQLRAFNYINTGNIHNKHSNGGGHGYVGDTVGYCHNIGEGEHYNYIDKCANIARISSDNGDSIDAINTPSSGVEYTRNLYVKGANTAVSACENITSYKKLMLLTF